MIMHRMCTHLPWLPRVPYTISAALFAAEVTASPAWTVAFEYELMPPSVCDLWRGGRRGIYVYRKTEDEREREYLKL